MRHDLPFSRQDIMSEFGDAVYPASLVVQGESAFWLEKTRGGDRLSVAARPDDPSLAAFQGELQAFKNDFVLKRCPTDQENCRSLRAVLPWLKPALLGLQASAGMGDRIGLATPGHARALGALQGNGIAPVFAQQSIREMERTGRTPGGVMSDATWGVFQSGLQCRIGADADHLKTTADIDSCAASGFTLFTIDPGAHVDDEADSASPNAVARKVHALPWGILESCSGDLERRYAGRKFDLEPVDLLEPLSLVMEREHVLRAAAKYGRAVAHAVSMARHLAASSIPHELEISVDETRMPTSLAEHIYVASELKRLNVKWVSLAPRYVGRFEKGIEYIGDLETIGRHLAGHAAIARALGPYKLSLHSGSDKFSVYPLMSRACGSLVHLKTAGTSYVEALRVIASVDAGLFRDIARLAVERYREDRATYHVSAEPARVADLAGIPDGQLPALPDDRNWRQILHVTFGSVLQELGAELKAALRANGEAYHEILERHFRRHLEPFLGEARRS